MRGVLQKERYGRDWDEYLLYDEKSPSGLVWKVDRLRGNHKVPYVFRPAGSVAGYLSAANGYWGLSTTAMFYDKLVNVMIHRIIYEMHHGPLSDDLCVDHIDGDKSNNKISNLRAITKAENSRNAAMYANNTTGVVGVYLEQSKGTNRYKAMWMDMTGKQCSKSFNINIHGQDEAFDMACEYRAKMIEKLNTEGAGYSDRHGLTQICTKAC